MTATRQPAINPLIQTGRPAVDRFVQAYLEMAKFYRPNAPGDGMGNVHLTRAELRNKARLEKEAVGYAIAFRKEEDTGQFSIGCSEFETNQAFMYLIEAARNLAGCNPKGALQLIRLAQPQIEKAAARPGIREILRASK